MAITSLSEVQNDYGSYRGNSLVGDLGSVGSVPNNGLENIVGKPYPFLNGIILNIGGVLYTDSGYLNALKAAGNPYISKRSLPTVPLQLSDLTTLVEDQVVYGIGSDAVLRTQYAEANVTRRMNSVDDILRYLNDFFNPNTTDTVLGAEGFGSWDLSLISNYDVELDVVGLYPGFEFEPFGEDLQPPPSSPPTQTEPKLAEPIITVDVETEGDIPIIPIDIGPIDILPLDIGPLDIGNFDFDFSNLDFGFGDFNTNTVYGLGGNTGSTGRGFTLFGQR